MTIRELPVETRLIQIAEESAELSQAALKMIRAMHGDTPVSQDEAAAHLIEEIADVSVCMTALHDVAPMRDVCEIISKKAERWEVRVNGEG